MSISELGLKVTQSTTTPTCPGKKPRSVWIVTGNVEGLEAKLQELGGHRYKGVWSFWNDPSLNLEELTQNDRMTVEERIGYCVQRSQTRAERLEESAQKHLQKGAAVTRSLIKLLQA